MAATTTAAPKKKNWFLRHKFLTAILIIVVIAIIGSMGASGDEDATAGTSGSGTSSSGDSSSTDSSSGNDDSAKADSDAEAEDEEEAPDSPADAGLGSTVNTGNFDVTVTAVEAGVTVIGNEYLNETPSGQFVLVRITVANTSNESDYFHGSDHTLIDEQGRKHSTSSGSLYLDEPTFVLESINPGVSIDGVLLYDIPVDATPVSLELESDEIFGDSILVSLE